MVLPPVSPFNRQHRSHLLSHASHRLLSKKTIETILFFKYINLTLADPLATVARAVGEQDESKREEIESAVAAEAEIKECGTCR